MTIVDLLTKAVTERTLTAAERAKLPPAALAQLALAGHIDLTPADRRRISRATLVHLALTNAVQLTRIERDRLSPHQLTIVALAGQTQLEPVEIDRLPRGLRPLVEQRLRQARQGARTAPNRVSS
jgi:hypothetical protein